MLNSFVPRKKAWWCALGLCLGLLSAPAFSATPTFSTVFAFDLHTTSAGVVQGTGANQNYLYGTLTDTSLSYGGVIYKVALGGGAPEVVYQLQSTEGYSPQAGLLVSTDGYIYGSTYYGPRVGTNTVSGAGTIFRIAQDGTGFTTLHTFGAATGTESTTGNVLNADGFYPSRALIEDATYLYGVTLYGGAHGSGTVFRVRKADGAVTVLHSFAAVGTDGTNASEGAYPSSSLTLASDGRLYGVTSGGGANLKTVSTTSTVGTGTIYSLNTDGSGFQTIHNFEALDDSATISVNSEGVQPNGNLLEASSGVLVGTTSDGGDPSAGTVTGYGTVFRFDIATSDFNALYAFDSTTGASPLGELVQGNDGLVYGVTSTGSTSSTPVTAYGEIYSIDVTAADFTLVHPLTFAEGTSPTGGLIKASNGDLFGTAAYGNACTSYSSSGYGAVFRYSLVTGANSSGYANCTQYSSSGGGAMNPGILWLLAALGLAPPVRRRLFGFN